MTIVTNKVRRGWGIGIELLFNGSFEIRLGKYEIAVVYNYGRWCGRA